jgi:hypothetical protein
VKVPGRLPGARNLLEGLKKEQKSPESCFHLGKHLLIYIPSSLENGKGPYLSLSLPFTSYMNFESINRLNCVLPKRYLEVTIPSTSECNLIWSLQI